MRFVIKNSSAGDKYNRKHGSWHKFKNNCGRYGPLNIQGVVK